MHTTNKNEILAFLCIILEYLTLPVPGYLRESNNRVGVLRDPPPPPPSRIKTYVRNMIFKHYIWYTDLYDCSPY